MFNHGITAATLFLACSPAAARGPGGKWATTRTSSGGTIVAITHDRYFLDNAAEWILELDRGKGNPAFLRMKIAAADHYRHVVEEAIGLAGQARAGAEYDEVTMIERYRKLYWGAIAKAQASA